MVQSGLERGIETTEEISNEIAKYSLWVFLGLVAALFITAFPGYAGARTSRHSETGPAV